MKKEIKENLIKILKDLKVCPVDIELIENLFIVKQKASSDYHYTIIAKAKNNFYLLTTFGTLLQDKTVEKIIKELELLCSYRYNGWDYYIYGDKSYYGKVFFLKSIFYKGRKEKEREEIIEKINKNYIVNIKNLKDAEYFILETLSIYIVFFIS